jgi:hypothetical protein
MARWTEEEIRSLVRDEMLRGKIRRNLIPEEEPAPEEAPTGLSGLVLYCSTNSPGKHDASGAFIPEAKAFAKCHGIPNSDVIGMGGSGTARRMITLEALRERAGRNLDCIALFCHGTSKWLQLVGGLKHVHSFAEQIAACIAPGATIILYACSTADGPGNYDGDDLGASVDGGFADKLRDELSDLGCRGLVIAHETAGHTTWNPYAIWLSASGTGRAGNEYYVSPRAGYWRRWIKALRSTDLRYRFPFMTGDEIRAELDATE